MSVQVVPPSNGDNPLMENDYVCNDGNPMYYYTSLNENSTKWSIYLEGGGHANPNITDTLIRWEQTPNLMQGYNANITEQVMWYNGSYFEDEEYLNPWFWDANKVFIPYCTSDFFAGNTSHDVSESLQLQYNYTSDFIYIKGGLMVQAVLEQLPGLNNADYVLIGGDSAGAFGAFRNYQTKRRGKEGMLIEDSSEEETFNERNEVVRFGAYIRSGYAPYVALFNKTRVSEIGYGDPTLCQPGVRCSSDVFADLSVFYGGNETNNCQQLFGEGGEWKCFSLDQMWDKLPKNKPYVGQSLTDPVLLPHWALIAPPINASYCNITLTPEQSYYLTYVKQRIQKQLSLLSEFFFTTTYIVHGIPDNLSPLSLGPACENDMHSLINDDQRLYYTARQTMDLYVNVTMFDQPVYEWNLLRAYTGPEQW